MQIYTSVGGIYQKTWIMSAGAQIEAVYWKHLKIRWTTLYYERGTTTCLVESITCIFKIKSIPSQNWDKQWSWWIIQQCQMLGAATDRYDNTNADYVIQTSDHRNERGTYWYIQADRQHCHKHQMKCTGYQSYRSSSTDYPHSYADQGNINLEQHKWSEIKKNNIKNKCHMFNHCALAPSSPHIYIVCLCFITFSYTSRNTDLHKVCSHINLCTGSIFASFAFIDRINELNLDAYGIVPMLSCCGALNSSDGIHLHHTCNWTDT